MLDRIIGKNEWVVAMTADHGQTPLPETTGAWPIYMTELERDIGRHFDVEPKRLLQRTRPGHLWLNGDFAQDQAISAADVADFLSSYRLQDNVAPEREPVRDEYEGRMRERVFSAAFPSDAVEDVWDCVGGR
jgi:hypothetical protein